MTFIIGLTGRQYAGKDTAAAVFEAEGFEHIKLAGPLKKMIDVLLECQGVDPETRQRMVEGDLKEVDTPFLGGRSPRYAMRTIGTEWGRDIMADDFWVGIFCRSASRFRDVVCSDVRFPNEAVAINHMIRIERGSKAAVSHVSESHADSLPVDEVIINDCASIEDFQAKVKAAWEAGK